MTFTAKKEEMKKARKMKHERLEKECAELTERMDDFIKKVKSFVAEEEEKNLKQ